MCVCVCVYPNESKRQGHHHDGRSETERCIVVKNVERELLREGEGEVGGEGRNKEGGGRGRSKGGRGW